MRIFWKILPMASFDEARSHGGEATWQRIVSSLYEPRVFSLQQPARIWGTQVFSHKDQNSASNCINMEVDPSLFEPWDLARAPGDPWIALL